MRKKNRAEEKVYDWLEGLYYRRPVKESRKDMYGLVLQVEGGWRCLMDGGRLDTGVAKGSLSKELGELRSCRLCLDEQHECLEEEMLSSDHALMGVTSHLLAQCCRPQGGSTGKIRDTMHPRRSVSKCLESCQLYGVLCLNLEIPHKKY